MMSLFIVVIASEEQRNEAICLSIWQIASVVPPSQ